MRHTHRWHLAVLAAAFVTMTTGHAQSAVPFRLASQRAMQKGGIRDIVRPWHEKSWVFMVKLRLSAHRLPWEAVAPAKRVLKKLSTALPMAPAVLACQAVEVSCFRSSLLET